ncbi:protein wings apart-like [Onthophagus taurus]|uniref:protein wings apart-like n=1 Tax=Onthophagus taurus TaxID=166361 RepID=UPI0039BDA703
MSRGYGKYRRGGNSHHHHPSFQFDSLFKENSNRPSAARSAATVGKWGITSFTSIRSLNGENAKSPTTGTNSQQQQEIATATTTATITPKPKKFFKSRNTGQQDITEASEYDKPDFGGSYGIGQSTKRQKTLSSSERPSKKFFSSKTVVEKAKPPPIVLRISRGKSQLINNSSDESESTPTPSSTPSTSTSPRNTKDAPQQKSPSSMRITRSTRRSMQQDPSSSPATADTAGESFSSNFTSPKKDPELSPQYIPAEKYELERKAMYDNLLGINTSSASSECSDTNKEETLLFETPSPFPVEKSAQQPTHELTIEEKLAQMESSDTEQPIKSSEQVQEQEVDKKQLNKDNINEDLEDESEEQMDFTENNANKPLSEEFFDEDDSDSNSTAPEITKKTMKEAIEEHKEEILEKILEKEPSSEHPMQAPVKLFISKKKGSIFKSRVQDGSKKGRAIYRHKWSSDDKDQKNQAATATGDNNGPSESSIYDDFEFQGDPLTRISNKNDEGENGYTSVQCTKSDKGYYTIVKNVKKAYEMQEIGEFQEFNDDVDYILDALQDNNPISTRCLSAITLASKCMAPAFRMHVRAHGTVAKFFRALHDAAKDQSLGLCTATVMFVLSQDRLNMDLDRDCLELMLNLLESDVSYQQALDVCGLSSAQLEKNKLKVRELCAEIQSQGLAVHLNLENITVGQLAMETLLSLTSKRAGEWFKEELRELGGIEHIVKTICECCRQISDYVVNWTDTLLDQLRKVDRCLRVLENVTHNNEENQQYLLKYDSGLILDTLVKLYRLCDAEIPLYPISDINDKESTGTVIRETLLVTLKVLINLTHHFNMSDEGSSLIGSKQGIIDASLHLLLQIPRYIPDQKKFELGVLVLMLLINLIQDNTANKQTLISAKAPSEGESIFQCDKTAVEALIAQFYQWEESARLEERHTDAILDGKGDNGQTQHKTNEEFIEETVAKLLQKAGTHMEYTFLASYIVMLLGFLIMNNIEYQVEVRKFLRNGDFSIMVELLKKFFNFMNLTASTEASSMAAMRATEKVINYLEECDSNKKIESTSDGKCMDLSFTMAH